MKLALAIGAIVSSLSAVNAQQFGAYVGYDMVRFNPNLGISSFSTNGGDAQFEYKAYKWLKAVVDVAGVHRGHVSQFKLESTVTSFTAGPRVTLHWHPRIHPFAQVLVGANYATASAPVDASTGEMLSPQNPNDAPAVRLSTSHTGFAMYAGGGLDIHIAKHIAFRPIEADYYMARLPDEFIVTHSHWNNFRYTAGFNFFWGRE